MYCSCKQEDNDPRLFEQYLQKQFHTSIAKDTTIYVLLADHACSGCAKYIIERAKTPPDHYIFILPKSGNNYRYTHPNVLIDSSGYLGRLKFHKGNVCTIKTKDGMILDVQVYDAAEVTNIFQ